MDCHNWRNCEGDCENCEVTNINVAQAVQHWPDADYMTHNYSPEEILGMVRQLGERAERAERERDDLQKRLNNFIRDCGTTMSACPECGHGMSSRSGCLHCQRDELWEALRQITLTTHGPKCNKIACRALRGDVS
jgi:hypothetical protein